MKEDKPEVQYQPVPEWGSRASRFRPWGADTDAGRFEVSIPQPPTKKDDDWVVTVKVLKRPGEGPVVASLLIEPAWWVVHRKNAWWVVDRKNAESTKLDDPSLYEDGLPDEYEYEEDNPSEVPPGGLTRSRVAEMSWEGWREAAHEWLASLTPEDFKARGLDFGDIELAAPRKAGSRNKMTELKKAQTALRYVSAVMAGEPTGPAIAEFLDVGEHWARNLIGLLRKSEPPFLTETEGKKPGGTLTQHAKDILIAHAKTQRGGK